MIEFMTLMCQHPLTFAFILICLLVFIGLTYDFILMLFGRRGFQDNLDPCHCGNRKRDDGLEPANVPKNPPPPSTLEREEGIPDDGEIEDEFENCVGGEYCYDEIDPLIRKDWEQEEKGKERKAAYGS